MHHDIYAASFDDFLRILSAGESVERHDHIGISLCYKLLNNGEVALGTLPLHIVLTNRYFHKKT